MLAQLEAHDLPLVGEWEVSWGKNVTRQSRLEDGDTYLTNRSEICRSQLEFLVLKLALASGLPVCSG